MPLVPRAPPYCVHDRSTRCHPPAPIINAPMVGHPANTRYMLRSMPQALCDIQSDVRPGTAIDPGLMSCHANAMARLLTATGSCSKALNPQKYMCALCRLTTGGSGGQCQLFCLLTERHAEEPCRLFCFLTQRWVVSRFSCALLHHNIGTASVQRSQLSPALPGTPAISVC